jgi:hypothetical protein
MHNPSHRISRRSFLADTGMGFTGLALAAMLHRDGFAREGNPPPDGRPHFPAKAKSVIWIFCCGGTSHLESFDPKPELNRYAGKTYAETPYLRELSNPERFADVRPVGDGAQPRVAPTERVMGMICGSRRWGQSGLEMADCWPHLGSCADELAIVRSLWTTDNDHGAQMEFHTGRHFREGTFPTLGAWVTYGLGTLNQNLPEYVVLSRAGCGGSKNWGADYLGPEHAGVFVDVGSPTPISFLTPANGTQRAEQLEEFSLVGQLNRLAGIDYPDDPALRAHIRSYETAFGMQTAVPETLQLERETEATRRLYGIDRNNAFGRLCLVARRLVERGVRFVQIFSAGGCAGGWDHHSAIRQSFPGAVQAIDQPIAALLKDLKQRGLLEETLVVWGTEFGRTPHSEGNSGRNHHPYGFSAWLAGGGIQGGIAHGATDALGFHATQDRHYVTDIHATVLHQLGLDPRRLEVPGRKRLDRDFGTPIREIMG